MLRTLRAAAVLGLLGAIVVTGGSARAAFTTCGAGGGVEDRGNGWIASRPSYPSGGATTTLLSAPSYDSNLLLASNGRVVVRSIDAGCSWQPVLSATSTPGLLATETATVTALQVASSANSTRYVYVGITATSVTGVGRPFVAVSSNRGTTFTTGSNGLPPLGSVVEVSANPTVPQVAFAVVDRTLTVAGGREVVATSDAGASWAARTGPGGSADVQELAADPLGTTQLVARAGSLVVRSSDGGATFAKVSGDPGAVAHVVATPGPQGLQLGAVLAGRSVVGVSDDGGRSWRDLRTPFVPAAVGLGPLTGFVAASDGARRIVVVGVLSRRVNDIAPVRGPAPTALSMSTPTAAGFAAVGLAGGDVLREPLTVAGLPILQPPGHVLRPIQLQPAGALQQFPSTLLPVRTDLVLRSGTSRLVPYDLLVPRTPTPVDVMFLVDSTGSMSSVIESLRVGIRQIVGALDTAGLNIRFGIADFRDYPAPRGTAESTDLPYHLRRKVGPVDAELQRAINSIQTGGGTTDGGDSALTAVTQAVTGRGDLPWVEKGEGADFRPGALKLAMSAVDTNIHEGGRNYGNGPNPGPTIPSTVRDLQRTGVRSIGLAIGDLPVGTLTTLARGSHALAPAAGIDCNGDGTVDVRPFAPLVCQIGDGSTTNAGGVVYVGGVNVGTDSSSSNGLPAAVVSLASGQTDVKPVRLLVAQGAAAAKVVSKDVFRVDLHADNRLSYVVRVTCPRGASHQTIGLAAAAGGTGLATGTIGLTCSPAAPVVPPVVPPVPAPAAQAPAAPPAAPQPPAPNPNPNPNPNVNPAANVNVNTGVVDQEQDQPQLALAESDVLQMSFVGAAALLLAGACGVVAARRGQLSLGWLPGGGPRSRP